MENKLDITPEQLAGTKTEQNLHTALSGEAQAYLRYRWFEKKAKTDGFVSVSRLFHTTADNEMEHAEIWFRYLGGYSSTQRNLETAMGGEHFEWATMYDQFASEARAEGFPVIADLFDRIASVEKQHEANYREKFEEISKGKAFTSDSVSTRWICLNCGYVVVAKDAPAFCPACSHPQAYFEKQKNS